MAKRRTGAKRPSSLSLLLDLVKAADTTAQKLTGKPLAYHFEQFVNSCRGRSNLASQDVYDPYVVLGVRQDADIEVIKSSFRVLARKYHPDTGLTPDAHKFQAAKEAYDKIIRERKANARGS